MAGPLSADVTLSVAAGAGGKRYAVTLPSGATHTVTHNLNTQDVLVQVYNSATPFEEITVEVEHTTVNTSHHQGQSYASSWISGGGSGMSRSNFLTPDFLDNRLLRVATPVSGTDGVNKDYVDIQPRWTGKSAATTVPNASGVGITVWTGVTARDISHSAVTAQTYNCQKWTLCSICLCFMGCGQSCWKKTMARV